MNELNFNDRETYIAWRKQWKAEYKQLSSDIRQCKINYKNQQRRIVVSVVNAGKAWQWNKATIDGQPTYACKEYTGAFKSLCTNQMKARDMLSLLESAKEKSAEQRAASLAVRA